MTMRRRWPADLAVTDEMASIETMRTDENPGQPSFHRLNHPERSAAQGRARRDENLMEGRIRLPREP